MKWFVVLILVAVFLGGPIVLAFKINEADHLENENKVFFVSCTDENDNKIYENLVKYYEFNIQRGKLFILDKGERMGNIYTCHKLSWERRNAL